MTKMCVQEITKERHTVYGGGEGRQHEKGMKMDIARWSWIIMAAFLAFVAAMTLNSNGDGEMLGQMPEFLQGYEIYSLESPFSQKECAIRFEKLPKGGTITRVTSSDREVATAVCVKNKAQRGSAIQVQLQNTGTAILGFHIRWGRQEQVFHSRLIVKEGKGSSMRFQVIPLKGMTIGSSMQSAAVMLRVSGIL